MADNPEGRSADFQTLLEEVKRLTLEDHELKLQLGNRQVAEEKIRQVVDEKEEKIRQMAKENKDQEDTIQSLQATIKFLRDEKNRKRRITRQTLRSRSKMVNQKHADMVSAMKSLEEVKAERNHFLNSYDDLKEKNKDLEKENGDLSFKLESSEKKIRKLEKKLAAYEKKGKEGGHGASGGEIEGDHGIPEVEMVEEEEEEEYKSSSEEEDESSGFEFDLDGSNDSDDEDEI
ncbi:hypothetical protein M434DRAFT_8871 [Hypoxylon sp. CO27-5]|nr:hypothetical protein M434DRAFT_8871 [Hypoxylon sp. CO27-5]